MTKQCRKSIERAKRCGLTETDAIQLRRIALTLRRWYELECGIDHGCIQRDDTTAKPYWVCGKPEWKRTPLRDRERGAIKRLTKLMQHYPQWRVYLQTDPRNGTLYLCRPEDATDTRYPYGVCIA